jgi:HD-GYP domain-containing protein (c-di-GMP phosphodiesterase class II)
MRIPALDNVKENMQLAKNIYFTVDELVKIQTRHKADQTLKEVMAGLRENGNLSAEKVYKVVNDIIEALLQNPDIMRNLIEIRTMNDYLFAHNVAVCVLSLITGIALNYDESKLKLLGVGAVLHDIGKAAIPLKILNKKSKLSGEEYAVIQQHSQIGYNILKNCNNIHSASAYVAWQHHERFDGSGYPLGLKGAEIHEFARIAALADVYDAMSTDRVYRKRLMPQEVIKYIRDQEGVKFDPEYTTVFLQSITPFPIGSNASLSNGCYCSPAK